MIIFKTKIIKILSNYVLLPIFLIAIFVIAWSNPHIHIAKQHIHDGGLHQHQLEVHNHSLNNIDFSHNYTHLDTVKIEYKSNLQKISNSKKYISSFTTSFYLEATLINISIQKPNNINRKLSYLDYSKLHSRAPPQLS